MDNGEQTAVGLLQEIYRNPEVPLTVRMRAAIEAAPYEAPKLTAVAIASLRGDDFPSRLERALQRSDGARVPKLIELKPTSTS